MVLDSNQHAVQGFGRAMRAPTGIDPTLRCTRTHVVATIGRPFCIDTQFAVGTVQRRAGSEAARECKKTINYRFPSSVTEPAGENHLPPPLFLYAEGNGNTTESVPRFDLCYN